MTGLTKTLQQYDRIDQVRRAMEEKTYPLAFTGCVPGQDAHLISFLGEDAPCRLVITHRESRTKQLYEDLSFFDENTVLYPSKDLLFFSADVHGNQIAAERIRIWQRLAAGESLTIVASLDALLEKTAPFARLMGESLRIDQDSVLETGALRTRLTEMGYEISARVDLPGQFSIRGGIIDIFPLTMDLPVRIELWGDEVDSIRSFNPDNQRSIENLDRIAVLPASEMVLPAQGISRALSRIRDEYRLQSTLFSKKKKRAQKARLRKMVENIEYDLDTFARSRERESLLNYFYEETESLLSLLPEGTICFLDEPDAIEEEGSAFYEAYAGTMKTRLEEGYILPGQAELLYTMEEIGDRLAAMPLILLSSIGQTGSFFVPKEVFAVEARTVVSYSNRFDELIRDLRKWKKMNYRILLLSASATRAGRLAEDICEYDMFAYYKKNPEADLVAGQIAVARGLLGAGFEYPSLKLVVLTEKDIFKKRKKRRKPRSRFKDLPGEKIASLGDIAVGDYVVHERYGLGVYRGMEKIEKDGTVRDYISIEYEDSSSLLIGASQLDQIQKYSNLSGKAPRLNKLGTPDWEKTKARARARVAVAARELLDLYATRQSGEGYACGPDTVWQTEFEERFPFEETADQITAIEETKRDMESPKIMDRLLCGDVGYGKTEVAIRAAFKEVQESRQVAYLVPTTILAQQHYNTFRERMKDYPVEIAMLSRFCTAKEENRIVAGLKSGSIDIVIGTHKILSKKVQFHRLGLLIVDEEQRFGVRQKEKIKQLKKDVDVLALSATPIPRTLHMSISGIRDMSVLEEPPVDRKSIQTYVMEHNEELIREAIVRELARGGQVYYVYNRVSTIPDVARHIQELVPEAVVEYAHGRMGERQLEEIMRDFIEGEIQVLVSTTIIETGLDIPNVNTMIVQDANRFGLSQLYQLRGRVGRSSRKAYAFLMYRRDSILNEDARKRLAAIRDFTDLGSGFKIAMRDLEIRGAGNLLGAEQSGHMEEIGYELYCKMLNEALRKLQGTGRVEEDFHTAIELGIDAYIPAEYIENEADKLTWYKRISLITSREEYEDITDEMTDRYGDVPMPVLRLLDVALLKEEAHQAWLLSVAERGKELRFTMNPSARVQVDRIDDFLKGYAGKMTIRTQADPVFVYEPEKLRRKDLFPVVREVIGKIRGLLETPEEEGQEASPA